MSDKTERTGPLSGVRIVEFTSNMTAPLAAMWLADQGADVFKVEPLQGDNMRHFMASRIGVHGMGSMFASVNRNKRAIAIDIKNATAFKIIRELVKTADVVLQNFRPGVIDKLGFGYEDIKKYNPKVIFVSVDGFGDKGPYSKQRTYDTVIQAVSGAMSSQRDAVTGEPHMVNTAIGDKVTALTVSQAITAALYARATKGEGQHVKVNMLNAVLAFLWPDTMGNITWAGDNMKPAGNILDAKFIYKTKDGYMIAVSQSNSEWAGFCTAVGRRELIDDPRFNEIGKRASNFKEMHQELKNTFLPKTTQEWLIILREHDAVCAPVNSEMEVHLDPQVIAAGLVVEQEHPHAGAYRQPIPAAYFEKTPSQLRLHPPMIGEQTEEILGELGLSESDIADLRSQGAIK